jgi:predicted RNA binding protein YcfA (HicA-like mRNA interferase family)
LGKLKVLSGKDVCLILMAQGFEQVRQKGSAVGWGEERTPTISSILFLD